MSFWGNPNTTCVTWANGEIPAPTAGWPAPEDPDSQDDVELGGRDSIADRIGDEVDW
jgi:hypothetical protein